MQSHHVRLVCAIGVAAVFTVGCSGHQSAARTVVEASPVRDSSASRPPPPPDDASQANVQISDEIRNACGLTRTESRFQYNSAKVGGSARVVLEKLASCFSTGPMRGRAMVLVGHADPRGDEEYNIVLGGRRADNVKRVLVDFGVGQGQVATTSRGEMDATGTEETGWANDRRVDVTLGS